MTKQENIAKCLEIFQNALCLADDHQKYSRALQADLIQYPQSLIVRGMRSKRDEIERELIRFSSRHRCEIQVAKKAIREGNA
tara:strand:- start:326 stop:571 length:246 start_codon:yes stop_codon:yes gene_type:complete